MPVNVEDENTKPEAGRKAPKLDAEESPFRRNQIWTSNGATKMNPLSKDNALMYG